jgi:phosphatidate cytidylyltransferase
MTHPQPGGGRTVSTSAQRSGKSDFLPRVASAVVMAVLAIGTAWIGGAAFAIFWCLAAIAVLWEWHGVVGLSRRLPILLLGGAALAASTLLVLRGQSTHAVAALVLGSAITALLADPGRRGVAAFGPIYAGVLALAVPLLRQSADDGFAVVIWLFAVVWGTDTMAYFGGRTIGGPKLAPRLSPSKTWSGFGVGVLSGAVLGLFAAPRSDCFLCLAVAGLLGGALAQAGDLFESALKRRFGVKDAGSLIPGHGGLMDRLDGFIAAAVFATVVGLWRFGPDGAGAGLLQW